MEQTVIKLDTMEDVKREIDLCQHRAMTSVVELGYILRKADDAEIYRQEGYTSIYKFAKEVYGWDQSQTSRFMDINREFSEGGYSPVLRAKYEGFGKAKLAEMLTLPETVREEITPETKREEIREIKRDLNEAAAEGAKETFERAMYMKEQEEDPLEGTVEKLFLLPDMGKKIRKLYRYMKGEAEGESVAEEDIRMIIAPSGFGTVRVGGVMYFWRKDDFSTLRGMAKKAYSYTELIRAVNDFSPPEKDTPEEWYKNAYGKELPGQEKPKAEPEKKKPVHRPGKPTRTDEAETEQSVEVSTPERVELPGQEEIGNHVETMPVKYDRDGTEEPAAEGDCPYCGGQQDMVSSNPGIRLRISANGTGEIMNGSASGIVIFSYCPVCGKRLKGD